MRLPAKENASPEGTSSAATTKLVLFLPIFKTAVERMLVVSAAVCHVTWARNCAASSAERSAALLPSKFQYDTWAEARPFHTITAFVRRTTRCTPSLSTFALSLYPLDLSLSSLSPRGIIPKFRAFSLVFSKIPRCVHWFPIMCGDRVQQHHGGFLQG